MRIPAGVWPVFLTPYLMPRQKVGEGVWEGIIEKMG